MASLDDICLSILLSLRPFEIKYGVAQVGLMAYSMQLHQAGTTCSHITSRE